VGDRVLEIVVLLMSHLKENQGQLDNLEEISDSLKSQGFTDNEISSAYSWVLDQLQVDSQFLYEASAPLTSFRILSDRERQHFSTKSIGYLLQLKHVGVINEAQMEMVLERGSLIGQSPVDLEQIKIIIGTVLFRDSGHPEMVRQPSLFFPEEEGLLN
jgi:Smg protein